MRHLFTAFLSIATVAAALSTTPVAAQVPGNPGEPQTPTVYTKDYWAQNQSYAPGSGGMFAPIGAFVGSFAGGPGYALQPHAQCSLVQDFNGRYTSLCGP
jgi:hypothetical protein